MSFFPRNRGKKDYKCSINKYLSGGIQL